ncbi:hypothetical protein SDC9_141806 [bioreactor metagenome]|uniref:Uncharacterized protein n=1 Tax=bioreactor metagenome TaxID=1076179 RepID=A0A645DZU3_9ZZZZ
MRDIENQPPPVLLRFLTQCHLLLDTLCHVIQSILQLGELVVQPQIDTSGIVPFPQQPRSIRQLSQGVRDPPGGYSGINKRQHDQKDDIDQRHRNENQDCLFKIARSGTRVPGQHKIDPDGGRKGDDQPEMALLVIQHIVVKRDLLAFAGDKKLGEIGGGQLFAQGGILTGCQDYAIVIIHYLHASPVLHNRRCIDHAIVIPHQFRRGKPVFRKHA